MREILFHGKRVDNGEWVEGLLFTYNGKYCIQLEGIECDDYGLYPRCYAEVIPESISEFTSLTDKNGKKIFEGDYCRVTRHCILCYGSITFIKGSFWFDEFNTDSVLELSKLEINNFKIEVIGNIHDNPELLKGEANA